MRNSHARALCQGASAQHARVTGTNADARSIGRYIGASLVHHSHKTQRDADFLQVKTTIDGAVLKYTTYRIGQIGKLLKPSCHSVDAFCGKQQTIKQTRSRSRLARSLHIKSVLLQNLVCVHA